MLLDCPRRRIKVKRIQEPILFVRGARRGTMKDSLQCTCDGRTVIEQIQHMTYICRPPSKVYYLYQKSEMRKKKESHNHSCIIIQYTKAPEIDGRCLSFFFFLLFLFLFSRGETRIGPSQSKGYIHTDRPKPAEAQQTYGEPFLGNQAVPAAARNRRSMCKKKGSYMQ